MVSLMPPLLHLLPLMNHPMLITVFAKVDVTKSTGPDNIVGHMIKTTAWSITSAVTALFNYTIRQGKIP